MNSWLPVITFVDMFKHRVYKRNGIVFYSHKWQTHELQILLNLRKIDKITNHIIVFFLSHSPFFSPRYVFLWYGWKTEVKKEARCRHCLAWCWSPQQCTPVHFVLGAAYFSLSLMLGYFVHGYLLGLHPCLAVMIADIYKHKHHIMNTFTFEEVLPTPSWCSRIHP